MDRELPISELPKELQSMKKKRKDFHAKAAAILTAESDARECTYPQGYVTQELFLCLSCAKPGELAAVCVGCYLSCHLDHEVKELGYKTGFRCDCGNSHYSTPCSLHPSKSPTNPENRYNHNFANKFCFCDSQDSEETREDELFMCVGCQDWFHSQCIQRANDCHNFSETKNHREVVPGVPEDAGEYHFLCVKCVDQARFLPVCYNEYIFYKENGSVKRVRKSEECPMLDHDCSSQFPYNVFLWESWLTERCVCSNCQETYKRPPFATFLTEERSNVLQKLEEVAESTLLSQEEVGATEEKEEEEDMKEFMDRMQTYPHAVQVELAHGVKLFQDTFSEFLSQFGAGRVLGEEHIEEFKRQLNDKYEAHKRTRYEA